MRKTEIPRFKDLGIGESSNNLNQGASIEVERELFEAEIRKLNPKLLFVERWPDGSYKHHGTDGRWHGWQMARRTPAATTGDGELPPLCDGAIMKVAEKMGIGLSSMLRAFAKEIARAAIAADRAQSQAAFDAVVSLAGDTIDARNAEIADLRAQLAAKGQGEPVAWMVGGMVVFRTKAEADANVRNPDIKPVPLYLAAPASAQPARNAADPSWYEGIEVVPSKEDRFAASGAQPDQRESAVEGQDSANNGAEGGKA